MPGSDILLCRRCGVRAHALAFRISHIPFVRPLCLRCEDTRPLRWLRITASLLMLPTALPLAVLSFWMFKAYPSPDMSGWILLLLSMLGPMIAPMIVWHELGHALVGRLTGFDVFLITIGNGPRRWAGRIRGVAVVVNAQLGGGATVVGLAERSARRRRHAAMILGGLIFNALAVLACLPLVMDPHGWGVAPAAVCALWAVILVNGFFVLANLYPHRTDDALATLSDGLALWRLVSGHAIAMPEHRFYAAWHASKELREFDLALEWAERGLREYPASVLLQLCHATSLLNRGQTAQPRVAFEALLARTDLEPEYRQAATSMLAYCMAVEADVEALPRALEFSSELIALKPPRTHAAAVHGAVLVQLGGHAEAVPHLEATVSKSTERDMQAEFLCWLALAHSGLGDRVRCAAMGRAASILDPKCQLLSWLPGEPGDGDFR